MPLKGTAPKPVKPRARSLIDDEAEESSEEEEEDEEMEGGCRCARAWGALGSRGVAGRVNACEQAAADCLPVLNSRSVHMALQEAFLHASGGMATAGLPT